MKILVTGGAGFIGSHVTDAYLEAGHDVAVIDDLSNGSRENLNPKARFHPVDIVDAAAVRRVFQAERPEVVSHHAAKADIALINRDPMGAFRTNIEGTANVLDAAAAAGVRKFIFISTSAVYGIPNYNPVDEAHPVQPSTPYGMTKVVGERLLDFVTRLSGMDWTILRYGNVYGPRQPIKGEAGVIGIFARTLLAGKMPHITGDGEQVKDYVYISDIVRLNVLLLTAGSRGLYNCGTGVGTSVNDIFRMVQRKVGFTCRPQYVAPREGDCSFVFNSDRARRELGWSATVPLDEGIDLTIAFERSRIGRP